MPQINFHPESDIPRFMNAANEYTKIWLEDGAKITEVIERVSGFRFGADTYNAIVLNKSSSSYPLILRYDYDYDKKKSTLIHELLHKVLPRNEAMKMSELENHKILNLILFDIWEEIYGLEFAQKSVIGEYDFQNYYKEAWDFALSFKKEERKSEYSKFLKSISLE